MREQQTLQRAVIDRQRLAVTRTRERLGQRQRQRNRLPDRRLDDFPELGRMRGGEKCTLGIRARVGEVLLQPEPGNSAVRVEQIPVLS